MTAIILGHFHRGDDARALEVFLRLDLRSNGARW